MYVLASLTDEVETWQRIFGGGPLAAFIGLLIVAVVALFILLQRAKNAHLATAIEVAPLTKDLLETVRANTDALQSAVRVLEVAIVRFDAHGETAGSGNRAHSPEAKEGPP